VADTFFLCHADNAGMDGGKIPVCYDGEFVLTADGNKDFGRIPEIKTNKTAVKGGVLRLRRGDHDIKTGRGYGEKHIEKQDRAAQLKKYGYGRARDFVEDTLKGYDSLFETRNSALFAAKRGNTYNDQIVIVRLEKGSPDFYDIKTAYLSRPDFLKNKTLLWKKLQGVEGRSPTGKKPPSAVSGHPDTSISPDSAEKSSPPRGDSLFIFHS
jgi:hypothetical protein